MGMQIVSYNQRALGVCYITSFEFKGGNTKFRRHFSELIISGFITGDWTDIFAMQ